MLVEQPQIYVLTAMFLYLYLLDDPEVDDRNIFFHGGLAISACYLIKAAALTVLPGVLFVLLILFFREPNGDKLSRIGAAIQHSIKILLPILLVIVSWRWITPVTGKHCLLNPLVNFTPEAILNISKLDWRELLERFTAAVFDYVVNYKSLVLIVAVSGMILALVRKRYLWL